MLIVTPDVVSIEPFQVNASDVRPAFDRAIGHSMTRPLPRDVVDYEVSARNGADGKLLHRVHAIGDGLSEDNTYVCVAADLLTWCWSNTTAGAHLGAFLGVARFNEAHIDFLLRPIQARCACGASQLVWAANFPEFFGFRAKAG